MIPLAFCLGVIAGGLLAFGTVVYAAMYSDNKHGCCWYCGTKYDQTKKS